jgi:tetratricopeptide (TPR) repeat protein
MGLLWAPLNCGRPADAERLVREAIPRAERIGNTLGKAIELWVLAGVYVAKGQLEHAERTARESLMLMESSRFGWAFIAELSLGCILLYRGQVEEALSILSNAAARSAPHYSGFAEGLLAWGMTATAMDEAAAARSRAMQYLPHAGKSRGVGTWNTVLSLTEAWGLSGNRQAAARLLAHTEAIAIEWDCSHAGFPVRTAAGIAATCAGDWERAEEHHRAAIARMDAVPYVTAQPIARYWYADMLAERRGPGDVEAADALLQSSIAASDAIGLALYAQLAKRKRAQVIY